MIHPVNTSKMKCSKYGVIPLLVGMLTIVLYSCQQSVNCRKLDFKNGIRLYNGQPYTGKCQSHYEDGSIKYEYTYKDGKKQHFVSYYKNGTKKEAKDFTSEGYLDQVTQWYKSGSKKLRKELAKDQRNQHKKIKKWYRDGTLMLLKQFDQKGSPLQLTCFYKENGHKFWTYTFKDKKLTVYKQQDSSEYFSLYNNGQLLSFFTDYEGETETFTNSLSIQHIVDKIRLLNKGSRNRLRDTFWKSVQSDIIRYPDGQRLLRIMRPPRKITYEMQYTNRTDATWYFAVSYGPNQYIQYVWKCGQKNCTLTGLYTEKVEKNTCKNFSEYVSYKREQ